MDQEKIFDFMCKMSQAMRDENIPIVNNIVHDFPIEVEEVDDKPETSDYYQEGDNSG